MAKARAIALYLPQFHRIPENDLWWGKGFTEWTSTAKAKPHYPGHYQPHVPADLGFYDLRVPEVREEQAALARSAGIEGFCYYHYWFAGRRILDRPFREVLASGKPDFPFCLCWANESWSGIWHGTPYQILIKQTYPGADDHRAHFDTLSSAFMDPRYIKVDGKPLFLIYKPEQIQNCQPTLELWRNLAAQAGLPGLHIVGYTHTDWNPLDFGFDAKVIPPLVRDRPWVSRRSPIKWLKQTYQKRRGLPTFHSYTEIVDEHIASLDRHLSQNFGNYPTYPCLVHAWDNTPRTGVNGVVLTGSTPAKFGAYMNRAIDLLRNVHSEKQIILFKSWNEWAEGNHLEPDREHGHAYLDTIRISLGNGK
jgi:lipopolysaccharide biosynthesis protein